MDELDRWIDRALQDAGRANIEPATIHWGLDGAHESGERIASLISELVSKPATFDQFEDVLVEVETEWAHLELHLETMFGLLRESGLWTLPRLHLDTAPDRSRPDPA